jgi:hypothetical protein
MKRIMITMLILIIATDCFAQMTDQKGPLTTTDYLQKSKKQKTTAWVLLGGGAALITIGALIPEGEVTGDLFPYPVTTNKNDGIRAAFILAGGGSMLASIPFFLASSKNRRKGRAATVFFDAEKVPVLHKTSISNKSIPALVFRIRL